MSGCFPRFIVPSPSTVPTEDEVGVLDSTSHYHCTLTTHTDSHPTFGTMPEPRHHPKQHTYHFSHPPHETRGDSVATRPGRRGDSTSFADTPGPIVDPSTSRRSLVSSIAVCGGRKRQATAAEWRIFVATVWADGGATVSAGPTGDNKPMRRYVYDS